MLTVHMAHMVCMCYISEYYYYGVITISILLSFGRYSLCIVCVMLLCVPSVGVCHFLSHCFKYIAAVNYHVVNGPIARRLIMALVILP